MLQRMAENNRSESVQVSPEDHSERVRSLLDGLNEPQREAVTHGEGPLLILAGAGSGKTRVLTHRVAFLIFTEQAHPSEILAITFTNKAAQEMRGRVERLLGSGIRSRARMWLMTFHAACARIMRAHAERLGYTSPVHDLRSGRLAADGQALHRGGRRRPQALRAGGDPQPDLPGQEQAARRLGLLQQAIGSPFEQMLAEVYQLYESELLRMNAMDFDDLLFRTVNLLELFEDVRTRYAQSFKHVLVDEYQDTNHAQYRLLQLLVGGGRAKPTRGASA